MRTALFVYFSLIISVKGIGQELYVFSDPASNIPSQSLVARNSFMAMPMVGHATTNFRYMPEVMVGIHKNWMVKAAATLSNMAGEGIRWEGASLYSKYRLYSRDGFHQHFRVAGFAKMAVSNNLFYMQRTEDMMMDLGAGFLEKHPMLVNHFSDEQQLEGNHSGWQVGLVATQLIKKMAISASSSYVARMDNGINKQLPSDATSGINATLSAGYLLLPRNYSGFQQTNLNLYVEILGQQVNKNKGQFVDMAPALQLIFNSTTRLDLGYRFQIAGNMRRFNTQMWLLRLEYNWLGALSKK